MKKVALCLMVAAMAAACGNGKGEEFTLKHVTGHAVYTAKQAEADLKFGIEDSLDLWWPTGLDAETERELLDEIMYDTVAQSFDQAVERYLNNENNDEIMSYSTDVKKAKNIDGINERSYAYLRTTCQAGGRLLTMQAMEELYIVLAAHPMTLCRYATIDASTQKIVHLEDVLNVKSVGEMVQQAIREIPDNAYVKESSEDYMAGQVFPEPDAFYIDAAGSALMMVYQQYSIAPYACGIQTVRVPSYWLTQRFGSAALTEYGKKLFN